MQAGTVTRVEKNVDQAASVLFGVACGYSAYLWLAALGRVGTTVVMALAAIVAVAAYVLSFRVLSSVQPDSRKLPVRDFRLREIEPLGPEDDFERFQSKDFPAFEPVDVQGLLPAPSDSHEAPELDELLLTDSYEPEKTEEAEEPQLEDDVGQLPELDLTDQLENEDSVDEQASALDAEPAAPHAQSRVVSLFDAAAMPTPGQLGSRIDRHLQRETAVVQSAEAAQALQDALAELRRAIPSRRG
jgi:hypothetical protein